MHYPNSTGLCCAPPTCVVHHGAQGEPMSVRSRGRPRHFSFFGGSHGSAQRSFVLITWCTRRLCMFIINSVRDGAQYTVVSIAGQVNRQTDTTKYIITLLGGQLNVIPQSQQIKVVVTACVEITACLNIRTSKLSP